MELPVLLYINPQPRQRFSAASDLDPIDGKVIHGSASARYICRLSEAKGAVEERKGQLRCLNSAATMREVASGRPPIPLPGIGAGKACCVVPRRPYRHGVFVGPLVLDNT